MTETKIKIDKSGRLHIQRGTEMKEARCRFSHIGAPCADDCSLFHEPSIALTIGPAMAQLELCHGSYYIKVDEFKDDRK